MQLRGIPVEQYKDFTGGLNTFMSAISIENKESPNLLNIEYTENGIPSKRRGTTVYSNNPDSIQAHLGSFYKSNSTSYHLRQSGTKLYKYNSSTDSWDEITGVTFTAGTTPIYVQALDAVYIHNGTDNMAKYNGTTLSQPSTGVKGKFAIFYSGRQIIAGNSTAPSRLYFSSSKNADNFTGKSGTATAGGATTLTDSTQSWTVNEFAGLIVTITSGTGAGQERTISSNTATALTVSTAWTTNPDNTSVYSIEGGDTLDVNNNDGQKITGLAKFESKLLIFKEFSIWQLVFDSSGLPVLTQVSNGWGCVSHRSIENVENDLFFLSHDGVRTFGYVANITVARTNLISAKIDDKIKNINTAYYEKTCAIYHDNKYMLAYAEGSSTTNNSIIVFQYLYGLWTYWTGLNVASFNEFISNNKAELYYGAISGDTYKMLQSGYKDNATAISTYYYSKQFDLGRFDIRKRFAFVDLQFRAITGTITIEIIIDGNITAKSVQLSSNFSSVDGLRSFMFRVPMFREDYGSTSSTVSIDDVRRVKVNKTGRTIQIKVSNNNSSEWFTLMGIALGYRARSGYSFDNRKVIY